MHPTDITARAALVGTAMMTAAVAVLATAPSAAAEDFGPDTCRQGYVWREARPTDHVCVTPATRDRARYDNSRAAGRRDPGHGGYGPNACKEGYVWREAFSGDVVCVEAGDPLPGPAGQSTGRLPQGVRTALEDPLVRGPAV